MEDEMGGVCSLHGRLEVDGSITLKRILRKQELKVCNEFIWFGIRPIRWPVRTEAEECIALENVTR
jgi:hypothetical protein